MTGSRYDPRPAEHLHRRALGDGQARQREHVVPVGGSLAVNTSAPNVQTNVHVHGELAPLLRIIDERIAHPSNVRQVSAQIARRSNGLFA